MGNITVQVANFSTSERTDLHEQNPEYSQEVATNELVNDPIKKKSSVETVTVLKPSLASRIALLKPAASESSAEKLRRAELAK